MTSDPNTPPGGSSASDQILARGLAELHDTDVARRVRALAAERAQDQSSLAIARALQQDVEKEIAVSRGLLRLALRDMTDEKQRKSVARAEDQLATVLGRLQQLISEVRPPGLEQQGLARTLRTLLANMCAGIGLEWEFIDELGGEPPAETAITLYWIAHQAVDNVRNHAKASKVSIEVKEYAGGFMVRVTDNGRGFDQAAMGEDKQVGFLAMNQRAEIRDGWWQVKTTPGSGTTVEVWIPAQSSFESGQGTSSSLG